MLAYFSGVVVVYEPPRLVYLLVIMAVYEPHYVGIF